jgi:hypothetical protein
MRLKVIIKSIWSKKQGEKEEKGTMSEWDKWKADDNAVAIELTISVIVLNIDGIETPFKRKRLSSWI